MAIASATWVIKRVPLPGNRFSLAIRANVTGDATGGTITASKDINNYIPNGYKAWVQELGFVNTDNIARQWHISIDSTHWENSVHDYLAAWKQDEMLTDGYSDFLSNPRHSTVPLPHYLGRLLSAAPTIAVMCATNTDAKVYYWYIKLLLEP